MTPHPTSAQRIGDLLRRRRAIAGLSQQALAERLGILQPRLARWETGRHPPSFEQVDRVLAHFGLRLRLDVEPRPDPAAESAQEQLRLASLTPAERLRETHFDLGRLVQRVRTYGAEATVDGQLAAWLQGVPGAPHRMQMAVTPDQVLPWLDLTWVVRFPVDDDLMPIHVPRRELAVAWAAGGGGLLNTLYGYVRLRVVPEPPPTVRLVIQTENDNDEYVEADVVRLAALPPWFQVAAS